MNTGDLDVKIDEAFEKRVLERAQEIHESGKKRDILGASFAGLTVSVGEELPKPLCVFVGTGPLEGQKIYVGGLE